MFSDNKILRQVSFVLTFTFCFVFLINLRSTIVAVEEASENNIGTCTSAQLGLSEVLQLIETTKTKIGELEGKIEGLKKKAVVSAGRGQGDVSPTNAIAELEVLKKEFKNLSERIRSLRASVTALTVTKLADKTKIEQAGKTLEGTVADFKRKIVDLETKVEKLNTVLGKYLGEETLPSQVVSLSSVLEEARILRRRLEEDRNSLSEKLREVEAKKENLKIKETSLELKEQKLTEKEGVVTERERETAEREEVLARGKETQQRKMVFNAVKARKAYFNEIEEQLKIFIFLSKDMASVLGENELVEAWDNLERSLRFFREKTEELLIKEEGDWRTSENINKAEHQEFKQALITIGKASGHVKSTPELLDDVSVEKGVVGSIINLLAKYKVVLGSIYGKDEVRKLTSEIEDWENSCVRGYKFSISLVDKGSYCTKEFKKITNSFASFVSEMKKGSTIYNKNIRVKLGTSLKSIQERIRGIPTSLPLGGVFSDKYANSRDYFQSIKIFMLPSSSVLGNYFDEKERNKYIINISKTLLDDILSNDDIRNNFSSMTFEQGLSTEFKNVLSCIVPNDLEKGEFYSLNLLCSLDKGLNESRYFPAVILGFNVLLEKFAIPNKKGQFSWNVTNKKNFVSFILALGKYSEELKHFMDLAFPVGAEEFLFSQEGLIFLDVFNKYIIGKVAKLFPDPSFDTSNFGLFLRKLKTKFDKGFKEFSTFSVHPDKKLAWLQDKVLRREISSQIREMVKAGLLNGWKYQEVISSVVVLLEIVLKEESPFSSLKVSANNIVPNERYREASLKEVFEVSKAIIPVLYNHLNMSSEKNGMDRKKLRRELKTIYREFLRNIVQVGVFDKETLLDSNYFITNLSKMPFSYVVYLSKFNNVGNDPYEKKKVEDILRLFNTKCLDKITSSCGNNHKFIFIGAPIEALSEIIEGNFLNNSLKPEELVFLSSVFNRVFSSYNAGEITGEQLWRLYSVLVANKDDFMKIKDLTVFNDDFIQEVIETGSVMKFAGFNLNGTDRAVLHEISYSLNTLNVHDLPSNYGLLRKIYALYEEVVRKNVTIFDLSEGNYRNIKRFAQFVKELYAKGIFSADFDFSSFISDGSQITAKTIFTDVFLNLYKGDNSFLTIGKSNITSLTKYSAALRKLDGINFVRSIYVTGERSTQKISGERAIEGALELFRGENNGSSSVTTDIFIIAAVRELVKEGGSIPEQKSKVVRFIKELAQNYARLSGKLPVQVEISSFTSGRTTQYLAGTKTQVEALERENVILHAKVIASGFAFLYDLYVREGESLMGSHSLISPFYNKLVQVGDYTSRKRSVLILKKIFEKVKNTEGKKKTFSTIADSFSSFVSYVEGTSLFYPLESEDSINAYLKSTFFDKLYTIITKKKLFLYDPQKVGSTNLVYEIALADHDVVENHPSSSEIKDLVSVYSGLDKFSRGKDEIFVKNINYLIKNSNKIDINEIITDLTNSNTDSKKRMVSFLAQFDLKKLEEGNLFGKVFHEDRFISLVKNFEIFSEVVQKEKKKNFIFLLNDTHTLNNLKRETAVLTLFTDSFKALGEASSSVVQKSNISDFVVWLLMRAGDAESLRNIKNVTDSIEIIKEGGGKLLASPVLDIDTEMGKILPLLRKISSDKLPVSIFIDVLEKLAEVGIDIPLGDVTEQEEKLLIMAILCHSNSVSNQQVCLEATHGLTTTEIKKIYFETDSISRERASSNPEKKEKIKKLDYLFKQGDFTIKNSYLKQALISLLDDPLKKKIGYFLDMLFFSKIGGEFSSKGYFSLSEENAKKLTEFISLISSKEQFDTEKGRGALRKLSIDDILYIESSFKNPPIEGKEFVLNTIIDKIQANDYFRGFLTPSYEGTHFLVDISLDSDFEEIIKFLRVKAGISHTSFKEIVEKVRSMRNLRAAQILVLLSKDTYEHLYIFCGKDAEKMGRLIKLLSYVPNFKTASYALNYFPRTSLKSFLFSQDQQIDMKKIRILGSIFNKFREGLPVSEKYGTYEIGAAAASLLNKVLSSNFMKEVLGGEIILNDVVNSIVFAISKFVYEGAENGSILDMVLKSFSEVEEGLESLMNLLPKEEVGHFSKKEVIDAFKIYASLQKSGYLLSQTVSKEDFEKIVKLVFLFKKKYPGKVIGPDFVIHILGKIITKLNELDIQIADDVILRGVRKTLLAINEAAELNDVINKLAALHAKFPDIFQGSSFEYLLNKTILEKLIELDRDSLSRIISRVGGSGRIFKILALTETEVSDFSTEEAPSRPLIEKVAGYTKEDYIIEYLSHVSSDIDRTVLQGMKEKGINLEKVLDHFSLSLIKSGKRGFWEGFAGGLAAIKDIDVSVMKIVDQEKIIDDFYAAVGVISSDLLQRNRVSPFPSIQTGDLINKLIFLHNNLFSSFSSDSLIELQSFKREVFANINDVIEELLELDSYDSVLYTSPGDHKNKDKKDFADVFFYLVSEGYNMNTIIQKMDGIYSFIFANNAKGVQITVDDIGQGVRDFGFSIFDFFGKLRDKGLLSSLKSSSKNTLSQVVSLLLERYQFFYSKTKNIQDRRFLSAIGRLIEFDEKFLAYLVNDTKLSKPLDEEKIKQDLSLFIDLLERESFLGVTLAEIAAVYNRNPNFYDKNRNLLLSFLREGYESFTNFERLSRLEDGTERIMFIKRTAEVLGLEINDILREMSYEEMEELVSDDTADFEKDFYIILNRIASDEMRDFFNVCSSSQFCGNPSETLHNKKDFFRYYLLTLSLERKKKEDVLQNKELFSKVATLSSKRFISIVSVLTGASFSSFLENASKMNTDEFISYVNLIGKVNLFFKGREDSLIEFVNGIIDAYQMAGEKVTTAITRLEQIINHEYLDTSFKKVTVATYDHIFDFLKEKLQIIKGAAEKKVIPLYSALLVCLDVFENVLRVSNKTARRIIINDFLLRMKEISAVDVLEEELANTIRVYKLLGEIGENYITTGLDFGNDLLPKLVTFLRELENKVQDFSVDEAVTILGGVPIEELEEILGDKQQKKVFVEVVSRLLLLDEQVVQGISTDTSLKDFFLEELKNNFYSSKGMMDSILKIGETLSVLGTEGRKNFIKNVLSVYKKGELSLVEYVLNSEDKDLSSGLISEKEISDLISRYNDYTELSKIATFDILQKEMEDLAHISKDSYGEPPKNTLVGRIKSFSNSIVKKDFDNKLRKLLVTIKGREFLSSLLKKNRSIVFHIVGSGNFDFIFESDFLNNSMQVEKFTNLIGDLYFIDFVNGVSSSAKVSPEMLLGGYEGIMEVFSSIIKNVNGLKENINITNWDDFKKELLKIEGGIAALAHIDKKNLNLTDGGQQGINSLEIYIKRLLAKELEDNLSTDPKKRDIYGCLGVDARNNWFPSSVGNPRTVAEASVLVNCGISSPINKIEAVVLYLMLRKNSISASLEDFGTYWSKYNALANSQSLNTEKKKSLLVNFATYFSKISSVIKEWETRVALSGTIDTKRAIILELIKKTFTEGYLSEFIKGERIFLSNLSGELVFDMFNMMFDADENAIKSLVGRETSEDYRKLIKILKIFSVRKDNFDEVIGFLDELPNNTSYLPEGMSRTIQTFYDAFKYSKDNDRSISFVDFQMVLKELLSPGGKVASIIVTELSNDVSLENLSPEEKAFRIFNGLQKIRSDDQYSNLLSIYRSNPSGFVNSLNEVPLFTMVFEEAQNTNLSEASLLKKVKELCSSLEQNDKTGLEQEIDKGGQVATFFIDLLGKKITDAGCSSMATESSCNKKSSIEDEVKGVLEKLTSERLILFRKMLKNRTTFCEGKNDCMKPIFGLLNVGIKLDTLLDNLTFTTIDIFSSNVEKIASLFTEEITSGDKLDDLFKLIISSGSEMSIVITSLGYFVEVSKTREGKEYTNSHFHIFTDSDGIEINTDTLLRSSSIYQELFASEKNLIRKRQIFSNLRKLNDQFEAFGKELVPTDVRTVLGREILLYSLLNSDFLSKVVVFGFNNFVDLALFIEKKRMPSASATKELHSAVDLLNTYALVDIGLISTLSNFLAEEGDWSDKLFTKVFKKEQYTSFRGKLEKIRRIYDNLVNERGVEKGIARKRAEKVLKALCSVLFKDREEFSGIAGIADYPSFENSEGDTLLDKIIELREFKLIKEYLFNGSNLISEKSLNMYKVLNLSPEDIKAIGEKKEHIVVLDIEEGNDIISTAIQKDLLLLRCYLLFKSGQLSKIYDIFSDHLTYDNLYRIYASRNRETGSLLSRNPIDFILKGFLSQDIGEFLFPMGKRISKEEVASKTEKVKTLFLRRAIKTRGYSTELENSWKTLSRGEIISLVSFLRNLEVSSPYFSNEAYSSFKKKVSLTDLLRKYRGEDVNVLFNIYARAISLGSFRDREAFLETITVNTDDNFSSSLLVFNLIKTGNFFELLSNSPVSQVKTLKMYEAFLKGFRKISSQDTSVIKVYKKIIKDVFTVLYEKVAKHPFSLTVENIYDAHTKGTFKSFGKIVKKGSTSTLMFNTDFITDIIIASYENFSIQKVEIEKIFSDILEKLKESFGDFDSAFYYVNELYKDSEAGKAISMVITKASLLPYELLLLSPAEMRQYIKHENPERLIEYGKNYVISCHDFSNLLTKFSFSNFEEKGSLRTFSNLAFADKNTFFVEEDNIEKIFENNISKGKKLEELYLHMAIGRMISPSVNDDKALEYYKALKSFGKTVVSVPFDVRILLNEYIKYGIWNTHPIFGFDGVLLINKFKQAHDKKEALQIIYESLAKNMGVNEFSSAIATISDVPVVSTSSVSEHDLNRNVLSALAFVRAYSEVTTEEKSLANVYSMIKDKVSLLVTFIRKGLIYSFDDLDAIFDIRIPEKQVLSKYITNLDVRDIHRIRYFFAQFRELRSVILKNYLSGSFFPLHSLNNKMFNFISTKYQEMFFHEKQNVINKFTSEDAYYIPGSLYDYFASDNFRNDITKKTSYEKVLVLGLRKPGAAHFFRNLYFIGADMFDLLYEDFIQRQVLPSTLEDSIHALYSSSSLDVIENVYAIGVWVKYAKNLLQETGANREYYYNYLIKNSLLPWLGFEDNANLLQVRMNIKGISIGNLGQLYNVLIGSQNYYALEQNAFQAEINRTFIDIVNYSSRAVSNAISLQDRALLLEVLNINTLGKGLGGIRLLSSLEKEDITSLINTKKNKGNLYTALGRISKRYFNNVKVEFTELSRTSGSAQNKEMISRLLKVLGKSMISSIPSVENIVRNLVNIYSSEHDYLTKLEKLLGFFSVPEIENFLDGRSVETILTKISMSDGKDLFMRIPENFMKDFVKIPGHILERISTEKELFNMIEKVTALYSKLYKEEKGVSVDNGDVIARVKFLFLLENSNFYNKFIIMEDNLLLDIILIVDRHMLFSLSEEEITEINKIFVRGQERDVLLKSINDEVSARRNTIINRLTSNMPDILESLYVGDTREVLRNKISKNHAAFYEKFSNIVARKKKETYADFLGYSFDRGRIDTEQKKKERKNTINKALVINSIPEVFTAHSEILSGRMFSFGGLGNIRENDDDDALVAGVSSSDERYYPEIAKHCSVGDGCNFKLWSEFRYSYNTKKHINLDKTDDTFLVKTDMFTILLGVDLERDVMNFDFMKNIGVNIDKVVLYFSTSLAQQSLDDNISNITNSFDAASFGLYANLRKGRAFATGHSSFSYGQNVLAERNEISSIVLNNRTEFGYHFTLNKEKTLNLIPKIGLGHRFFFELGHEGTVIYKFEGSFTFDLSYSHKINDNVWFGQGLSVGFGLSYDFRLDSERTITLVDKLLESSNSDFNSLFFRGGIISKVDYAINDNLLLNIGLNSNIAMNYIGSFNFSAGIVVGLSF